MNANGGEWGAWITSSRKQFNLKTAVGLTND